MKHLLILTLIVLCSGCASTLWIDRKYENNIPTSGAIRRNANERSYKAALEEAKAFCAPKEMILIHDGLREGRGRGRFHAIEFQCRDKT